MSVFRKILNAPMAFDSPPPPIAETANWIHAVLVLADASAIGNDETTNVPAEVARRLTAAGVSPLIVGKVVRYAENLKV